MSWVTAILAEVISKECDRVAARTSRHATREDMVRKLSDAIGRRKLFWFGPRGADGLSLLELDQFDGSFSLMSPLEAVSVGYDVSLETLMERRVDHNTYDLNADTSDAVRIFRDKLLSALSQPCAIMPYRPNRFLSNICFPRGETAQHLGQFYEHQSQFEHKPWVENELRRFGVSVLPWRYFADEDRPRLREYFDSCKTMVLRASRSDGGARVELVESAEALERHIPQHDDGFLSACLFFEKALSVNINACIFPDGTTILQGLSEQLIGVPELVSRRFGYCGNRFLPADEWPPGLVEKFEVNARLSARWLHSQGYRGVFGIDALFVDGELFVVEINPRFQGSTWAAAGIDKDLGLPDMYLLQLAVELGIDAPELPQLNEVLCEVPGRNLMIAHNLTSGAIKMDASRLEKIDAFWTIDLIARPEILIEPGAIVARFVDKTGSELTREKIRRNVEWLYTPIGVG
jgi:ATP-grasp domain